MFAARASGTLVGIGRIKPWPEDQDSWMVYGLAVHPDHRREGIGRSLVRARVRFALSKGAKRIRSEAHLDNPVSIAFHKAVGFVDQGPFLAEDGDPKVAFIYQGEA